MPILAQFLRIHDILKFGYRLEKARPFANLDVTRDQVEAV